MKKYFITADVHGFYSILKHKLKSLGFNEKNKDHILVICGDAFDRGGEEFKLLNFLNKLRKNNQLIYVKGNHDTLLWELLTEQRDLKYVDFHNGTAKTVYTMAGIKPGAFEDVESCLRANLPLSWAGDQYVDFPEFEDVRKKSKKKFSPLFNSMVDYFETDNHIFVHGWIPCIFTESLNKAKYLDDWRNSSELSWDRARWVNGIQYSIDGCLEPNKTIVCGHWHASYGNVRKYHPEIAKSHKVSLKEKQRLYKDLEFSNGDYFKPYVSKGIIALDACTAYSRTINVLVLNEDEI